MLDLLCVGDVNQDIITPPIKSYPKRDEQIVVDSLKYYLGGSAAICAASSRALGMNTGFIGALGHDIFGEQVNIKLKMFKLKSKIKFVSAPTDTTFAATFSDGKRSFITAHGANDLLSYESINNFSLRGARHLHIGGYWHLKSLRPKIKELLRRAKSLKMSTSLDIGSTIENENWGEIYALLPDIDILFLNEYELKLLTGLPTPKALAKLSPQVKMLVLHEGSRGAMACTHDSRISMDSFDVKVVNPTGAGDTFNAGFLYGFLKGDSIERCLKYAVANACIYISRDVQSFPSAQDLQIFLKTRS